MSMKRNDGFTLVEMLVTVAIGSMITLAATSLLLLGLRIHHQSNITAAQQNTVAMFATVMDTIASENAISIAHDDKKWELTYGDSSTITYDGSNDLRLNGTTFLTDVSEATADLDEHNQLLKFKIKTDHSNYEFSVYCRLKGGA